MEKKVIIGIVVVVIILVVGAVFLYEPEGVIDVDDTPEDIEEQIDELFEDEQEEIIQPGILGDNYRSYIRPSETTDFLELAKSRDDFENNTENDIELIAKQSGFAMIYKAKEDSSIGTWQTPGETLSLETGNCADWSILFVSLMDEYDDEDLSCYAIGGDFNYTFYRDRDYSKTMRENCGNYLNHLNVICHIDNKGSNDGYYWFASRNRKYHPSFRTTKLRDDAPLIDKRKEIKDEIFGGTDFNFDKDKIFYAFNREDYLEFQSNDELLDWFINL